MRSLDVRRRGGRWVRLMRRLGVSIMGRGIVLVVDRDGRGERRGEEKRDGGGIVKARPFLLHMKRFLFSMSFFFLLSSALHWVMEFLQMGKGVRFHFTSCLALQRLCF